MMYMKTRILAAIAAASAMVGGAWAQTGVLRTEADAPSIGVLAQSVKQGVSGMGQLGTPTWLPVNKNSGAVTQLLKPEQQEALLASLGVDGSKLKQGTAPLKEAAEAVLHAKGANYATMTLKDVAGTLGTPQGHGTLFEQKVAQMYAEEGCRVEFTKVGNNGVDLRVSQGPGKPYLLVQAKAERKAALSLKKALLDGLEFAGGETRRAGNLEKGVIAFKGVIPFDQAKDLQKAGRILPNGGPSPEVIKEVLEKAKELSRGTGEKAERLKAVLGNAQSVLENAEIRPGPVAFGDLVSDTKAAVRGLRAAQKEVAAAAKSAAIAKAAASKASNAGEVAKTESQVAKASTATAKDAAAVAKRAGKAAGKGAEEAAKLGNGAKVLAGVGVIGGALQGYEGVQELREGKIGVGSANLVGSAANVTSSVAALGGKTFLSGSTMAVGAGIDGGLDLYKGISEHRTDKCISGGVKSAAAATMGVGLATAQPEVVVAGAVVYGGAAIADVAYENREALGRGVDAGCDYSRAVLKRFSKECQDNFGVAQRVIGKQLDSMQRSVRSRGQS
jgi:hypothetical protein